MKPRDKITPYPHTQKSTWASRAALQFTLTIAVRETRCPALGPSRLTTEAGPGNEVQMPTSPWVLLSSVHQHPRGICRTQITRGACAVALLETR